MKTSALLLLVDAKSLVTRVASNNNFYQNKQKRKNMKNKLGIITGVVLAFALATPTLAGATTVTVPSSPTNVTVTSGAGSLSVSWVAPVSTVNGTSLSYTATATAINGLSGQCLSPAPARTCVISQLMPGTTYSVSVTASNSAGRSLPSASATGTPSNTVPNIPGNVYMSRNTQSLFVFWIASISDGGSAITSYTATVTFTSSLGVVTETCTSTTTKCDVPLQMSTVNSSVSASVYATNALGKSMSSTAFATYTPLPVPVTSLVMTTVVKTMTNGTKPAIKTVTFSTTVQSAPANSVVGTTTTQSITLNGTVTTTVTIAVGVPPKSPVTTIS